MFTKSDLTFLKAVGVATKRLRMVREAGLECVQIFEPPIPLDGTLRLLAKLGIPATRENYLLLTFVGNPPEEPLDGEIEAQLPIELQLTDINNAPSARECDEPSYTTPRGFPICARCGKSTRNINAIVCAPCRNRTRLVLTKGDRRWLRELGIAR